MIQFDSEFQTHLIKSDFPFYCHLFSAPFSCWPLLNSLISTSWKTVPNPSCLFWQGFNIWMPLPNTSNFTEYNGCFLHITNTDEIT